MFLVVFVTLVISIIGLYAQVITLQTAKMNRAQTTLAQTMISWHTAAVDAARLAMNAPYSLPVNTLAGCRLTPTVTPPTGTSALLPATCSVASQTLTIGSGDIGSGAVLPTLPQGYNTSATTGYNFYSLVYQTTAIPPVQYVITYAHDTDANKDVQLPDAAGVTTGYTLLDLATQFERIHNNSVAYGWVNASGVLSGQMPGSGKIGGSVTYEIPASIPVGSLVTISPAK